MDRQQIAELEEERDDLMQELHSLRVQRMRMAGRVMSDKQSQPIEEKIRQKTNRIQEINKLLPQPT